MGKDSPTTATTRVTPVNGALFHLKTQQAVNINQLKDKIIVTEQRLAMLSITQMRLLTCLDKPETSDEDKIKIADRIQKVQSAIDELTQAMNIAKATLAFVQQPEAPSSTIKAAALAATSAA